MSRLVMLPKRDKCQAFGRFHRYGPLAGSMRRQQRADADRGSVKNSRSRLSSVSLGINGRLRSVSPKQRSALAVGDPVVGGLAGRQSGTAPFGGAGGRIAALVARAREPTQCLILDPMVPAWRRTAAR
jgi:hypothetical protein